MRDVDPLAPDPAQPVGLVLSGGGARGAFQVGVYEILHEHPKGLRGAPGAVSGTSAGAMNAALIAAGRSPREMLDFWLDLAERPPVKVNRRFFGALQRALLKLAAKEPLRTPSSRWRDLRMLGQAVRDHQVLLPSGRLAAAVSFLFTSRFDGVSRILDDIDTANVFDTSGLQDRLAAALGGRTFRPTIPLAVNAVDLESGAVVRYVSHAPKKHRSADASHYRVYPEMKVEMVAASAAIPILFNPVEIDGAPMWDGGLLVNTPLAPVVALGARRVLTLLVTAAAKVDRRPHPVHLGEAIERLADTYLENAYNVDRKLLLDRNSLAERLPDRDLAVVELFEAIRPTASYVFDAGSYLYFEPKVIRQMYEEGRKAAIAWLARGPRHEHELRRAARPEPKLALVR